MRLKQARRGLLGRPRSSDQEAACAAGARARQLSKQRLLDTLVERALDANAFTRARVMQTWAHLASASALPLGHWLCVTRLAVGAPRPHGRGARPRGHARMPVTCPGWAAAASVPQQDAGLACDACTRTSSTCCAL